MAEPAYFPSGMRRLGWILAAIMLLYPIDYFLAKREIQGMIAAERATRQSEPPASGMQFDLHAVAIHCGPIGWAGTWAFLIGGVWVFVAGGLWLYYRFMMRRSLAVSSRRALLVTATGVVIVLGFMLIEAYGLPGS